jgi:histidyl-tRNA synthetase
VFSELAFGKFTIFVNNRKLLRGLLESMQIEQQVDVLHEVDRLRKAGREKTEGLVAAIIGADKAKTLLDVLTLDWKVATEQLAGVDNATLREGIDELRRVYTNTLALGVPETSIKVDLSIVRGLDYYTGTVYETFLDEHPDYGSICSGGRYENLAGLYTKSKLPGVGISIGATRLFSQKLEAEKKANAPKRKRATAHVIVMNVEAALAGEYARLAAELRTVGLNVEVYGNDDKLGRQFKYADASGVPLSVMIGTQEQTAGVAKIKDLRVTEFKHPSENETVVPRAEVVAKVRELLQR